MVAGFTVSACSGERPGSFDQLPKTAQEVISQHFDKDNIAKITIDNDEKKSEYEVRFANGTELDFDQHGLLTKIKCKKTQVPDTLIPTEISAHVKTNYPATFIIEWEKEKKGSKVELNNGIELKFNNLNQFVGLDN